MLNASKRRDPICRKADRASPDHRSFTHADQHLESTKMLSTLPNLSHSIFQGTNYAPQVSSPLSSSPLRSSPLSPRDGNVPTRRFPMSSPTPTGKQQSEFSKRKVKSNPLIHNRNGGREARRNLFLRKVRESSEDRRWEARGGDDEVCLDLLLARAHGLTLHIDDANDMACRREAPSGTSTA